MNSRSDDVEPRSHLRRGRARVDSAADPSAEVWALRADAAESAVVSRHLQRLWLLPRTGLGVVGWPASLPERLFFTWNYWWQAHLIDCAIDAASRAPSRDRTGRIEIIARTHRLRNLTGWTNNYYDDMAWLALALERAERTQGLTDVRGGLIALEQQLMSGWQPEIGAVPWRKDDDYFNAPANGPTAVALARLGHVDRAAGIADWIDATLRDPETGLILDGIHLPSRRIERPTFTYCQGVVLGLETELAVHSGDARHADRVVKLLAAVEEQMTVGGVIAGGGGGDGGLFNGILARYLALVAVMLPGEETARQRTRTRAASLVTASARAAWHHRLQVEGEPLFGPDWSQPARLPSGTAGAGRPTGGGSVSASRTPERDLSVQLSGWMLMEAAQVVAAAGL
ncbi:glycoside hydrolase family 76 protein [Nocardia vermiculata]|uniref:Fructose-bisphosphate aldolase n=1 Tax=Nocardia vermiculata TaxID=257274 RepID=A0A846Y5H2_9NOCA|nr:glycoside hydrolase family 76 protein [Nocardia vermiculata]NKY52528.1 fructose-bisphosphate aldolase [Nocardia vermiculata]